MVNVVFQGYDYIIVYSPVEGCLGATTNKAVNICVQNFSVKINIFISSRCILRNATAGLVVWHIRF